MDDKNDHKAPEFVVTQQASRDPKELATVGPIRWGNGGDVNFRPGLGARDERDPDPEHGRPGRIRFLTADEKDVVLQIDGDGKVFVHGRLVATDREVFDGFVEWLEHARATYHGNAPNTEN